VAPDGRRYQVFVRDQRSQHQNRRLALSRLQALVDLDQREAEEARAAKTHRMHHQLERGNPVRRFQGPRFRKD
jgi:peptide chain release factor